MGSLDSIWGRLLLRRDCYWSCNADCAYQHCCLHHWQVFEGLPVTYNELFVDGLAKPDETVAKLAYQPAQKSFKVAIECPVVGQ